VGRRKDVIGFATEAVATALTVASRTIIRRWMGLMVFLALGARMEH